MTASTHELGQVAYEAYGAAVDWKAYDGKTIKPWHDQDEDRRRAWAAAAEAVETVTKTAAASCLMASIPAAPRHVAMLVLNSEVERKGSLLHTGSHAGTHDGPVPDEASEHIAHHVARPAQHDEHDGAQHAEACSRTRHPAGLPVADGPDPDHESKICKSGTAGCCKDEA